MFILKKDLKLRNILIIVLVFASALFVDINFFTPSSGNLQEARFLGIGRRVQRSPCAMGARLVITTYTIFWIIRVGDPTYEEESC